MRKKKGEVCANENKISNESDIFGMLKKRKKKERKCSYELSSGYKEEISSFIMENHIWYSLYQFQKSEQTFIQFESKFRICD